MAAAMYLKAQIQKNVDIATAAAGPSRPGEYPHKVTGTLQKSVFTRKRQDSVAVDVGTKLVYGVHWESTNRPYIRRTYAERLAQIQAILEGRMKRSIEDIRAEASAMRERHKQQKQDIKERKQDIKERKKAAREAKQERRKEVKKEAKAVKSRQKFRARMSKQLLSKKSKSLEKRIKAAKKAGNEKQAKRLIRAQKKVSGNIKRAQKRFEKYGGARQKSAVEKKISSTLKSIKKMLGTSQQRSKKDKPVQRLKEDEGYNREKSN